MDSESVEFTEYELPDDQAFPEGVVNDPRTGFFYVGGGISGTIWRGHPSRKQLKEFLPAGRDGRTEALGLKIDRRGRLYVAGGGNGQVWIYDLAGGRLIRRFDTGERGPSTLLNDMAFDTAGNVYVTDSFKSVLWRIDAKELWPDTTPGPMKAFVDFTGTPVVYAEGANLNGIVLTSDRRGLVLVQHNLGKLFHLELARKKVTEIEVSGGSLVRGDGLLLRDDRLLVVRNGFDEETVTTVELNLDRGVGKVISVFRDRRLAFPATAAISGRRLLVTNSQFDKFLAGKPVTLPFTVAGIPLRDIVH